jgi:anthranilate synthase/phosphoribosyltransferase
MNGLFINFYDSFSENIINEFNEVSVVLENIFWDDIDLIKKVNSHSIIVLGPGPGHVSDYESIYNMISEILNDKKVIGFCLGHQLIATALGYELKQLNRPLHGKSLPIYFNKFFVNKENVYDVQFYNSWYVDKTDKKCCEYLITDINGVKMLCALRGNNYLSYQFHPESVGTSCPSEFFNFIKDFLYNIGDVDSKNKI